jgi:imidazolonepropionase-like amidohydrolase
MRILRRAVPVGVLALMACVSGARLAPVDANRAVRSTPHAARLPVPGAPASITAFVDVAVVPMDTERVLLHQTVLIDGGQIVALGPRGRVRVPAGATQVDGRGQYLIPGLADMHVHLFPFADTSSARIERLLFLFAANGVTTVRNMDYARQKAGTRALQVRARAAAGELWSPRIYTSGKVWPKDPAGTDVPPESIAVYVAAYKAAGYDFIKVYQESGPVRDSLLAAARRLRMPVSGHAPELGAKNLKESLAAITAGYASVEHLTPYMGHPQIRSLPPDTLEMRVLVASTKQAGVWNDPTLAIVPSMGSLGASFNDIPARLRMVKALQDAGAGLLLGTDAGWQNTLPPGAGVHVELQALVAAGLTPYQALATGACNVAAFFGTLDDAGTIAVGKRADLVLLRGNPLADIRHTARPAGVMIGGRWRAQAELDEQLAVLASSAADQPQSRTYDHAWRYVAPPAPRDQQGVLSWNDLYWAYAVETTGHAGFRGLTLTETQSTSLRHLRAAWKSPLAALADSLVSARGARDSQRLRRLVARHLAPYRAVLTSEQQTVFDAQAQAWLRSFE